MRCLTGASTVQKKLKQNIRTSRHQRLDKNWFSKWTTTLNTPPDNLQKGLSTIKCVFLENERERIPITEKIKLQASKVCFKHLYSL